MRYIICIFSLCLLTSCAGLDIGKVNVGLKTDTYEAEYSSKGGLRVTVIQSSGK